MTLFCTRVGVINSDLVFIPSGSTIDKLVELNTGVGAIEYVEGVELYFSDSSSGLFWNELTPDYILGTMESPIHVGEYIYYYTQNPHSEPPFEGIKRIPYTLGILGNPETLISYEPLSMTQRSQLLFVNENFYWFYSDSTYIDHYLEKTSNFSVIDTFTIPSNLEDIVYFNNSFISLGEFNKSSVDGVTWITHAAPSFEIKDVAHNKVDMLIAIDETRMLSYDGISWSAETTLPIVLLNGVPIPWLSIAYNNGVFCIVGGLRQYYPSYETKSAFLTSVDNGSSWQIHEVMGEYIEEIVPMNPGKFWEHFIKTTES